jgi:hypothetical protein
MTGMITVHRYATIPDVVMRIQAASEQDKMVIANNFAQFSELQLADGMRYRVVSRNVENDELVVGLSQAVHCYSTDDKE